MEEDRRNTKLYDDTQKVQQLYMDEKNFDREQYAEQLANAYTNRANTFNMNSLQDYYRIDPTTGGMIGQFNSKAFEKIRPTEYNYMNSPAAKFAESWYNKYGQPPSPDLMKAVLKQSGDTSGFPETYGQRDYRLNNPMQGFDYRPNLQTRKEGGEVKSKITPFFTGIIGI